MSDTQDTGYYGPHDVTPRERESWAAEADRELSANARRALAHIKARTITGRFANQLYDMSQPAWRDALEELRAAEHRIEWTHGTVADDPTLTGGYVLREPANHEREATGSEPRFAERLEGLRGGRDDGRAELQAPSVEEQVGRVMREYRPAHGQWTVTPEQATRRVREALERDDGMGGLEL